MILIALSAGSSAAALAGEAEGGGGRVLLQPPRQVIPSPINDRFAVRLLYYRPQVDNRLRYDSSTGVTGTNIDVEDLLGHRDSAHQGTIDMMFRIGERNRIQADFYQLRRTGDVVLNQQLRFGDDTYSGGQRVLSETELRKLGVTWTFSPLRRERIELGLGLGVHLLQLDGRTRVPATFASEQLDTAGPFAALAGTLTWRMTRRFSVNMSGQYFDLNPDEVRGAFRHFHGDLQYRGWRNLSFGVGYSYSGYLVDSTDEEFSGFYRLVYKGPEAFIRVSF
ncbi:MAG: LPS assembly protein LptD [Pseudomonadota bacterium]|nr:LPS assembly protein LptD [Pseudomonadota bacterium]